MAAVNTDTSNIHNKVHKYMLDNVAVLEKLLEAAAGKAGDPLNKDQLTALLRGNVDNKALPANLDEPEISELGYEMYKKYTNKLATRQSTHVPVPNVATQMVQPAGASRPFLGNPFGFAPTSTQPTQSIFGAPAQPNPNTAQKTGQSFPPCTCEGLCVYWTRRPGPGEKAHDVSNRIPKLLDYAREQTIQNNNKAAQLQELTNKLQQYTKTMQDLEAKLKEVEETTRRFAEANSALNERMQALDKGTRAVTEENRHLKEENGYLQAQNKRLNETVEANLVSSEERALHTANNMMEVNAAKGRFTNVSIETPTMRIHATSASDAEAARVESISNHYQTANALRTVVPAMESGNGSAAAAVGLFLDFDNLDKYTRAPRAKAIENKKQDSRVEEVIEEKKQEPRVEDKSAKKQQEVPISEIVARTNITPEARFLKNPQEFSDFRTLVSAVDPYWPENYLSLLDPEFAVGWAKRHKDRRQCAEYLAKF